MPLSQSGNFALAISLQLAQLNPQKIPKFQIVKIFHRPGKIYPYLIGINSKSSLFYLIGRIFSI
jgi:hypothetical protein